MKQKKQKANNPRSAIPKNQSGSVKKKKSGKQAKWGPKKDGVEICMKGTEKVDRDTVLELCSTVINSNWGDKGSNNNQQLKNNKVLNKNKKFGGKRAFKETPVKPQTVNGKGVSMNYKDLKELRKKQAVKEAAEKAAVKADKERVVAKKGPQEITAKMVKAAKEKDAHRQGILHLWGRPGSGAYKERRKHSGKRGKR